MRHLHKIFPVGVLFLVGFLRLMNLNQPLWPDEALYAHTAKNLITHGELTFDGTPWTQQPPLFIFFIALSYTLFGVSETAVRIVGPLFGIIGILATYYLGKLLYGQKVGLIAAFFIAMVPSHWFFSRMLLADVLLATLVTLTLIVFYRGYEFKNSRLLLISGLFIGVTSLTKRIGPIIFLIIFSYLFLRERSWKWMKNRNIQSMLLVAVIILLPWSFRNYLIFHDPAIDSSSYFSQASSIITLSGFSFSNIKNLPAAISLPIFVPSLFGIYFIIKERRKEGLLVLLPIAFFIYVLSFWDEYEIRRYLLPTIPFISICAALGLTKLFPGNNKKLAILILTIFGIFVWNLHDGLDILSKNSYKYQGYKEAGSWIDKNTPKEAVVISNARAIWYYSNRKCTYFPDSENEFWENIGEDTYIVLGEWPVATGYPKYVFNLTERYPASFKFNASFNTRPLPVVYIYKVTVEG